MQIESLGGSPIATAYYSLSSGVSLAARLLTRTVDGQRTATGPVHIGIVGMGVGTISVYARPGDRVRYYELSPEVIAIAAGTADRPPFFTFLSRSGADTTTILGDGRLSLEKELEIGQPQQFDLLALDAFSSDSIPIHLLTEEAFRVYTSHLKDAESILAVHITNRYLDLEPVIAAHARDLGYHGLRVDSEGDPPAKMESSWILLCRDPELLRHPTVKAFGGRPLSNRSVKFTDAYSNLLRVLE